MQTSAIILGGTGGIGSAVTARLALHHRTVATFKDDAVRASALADCLRTSGDLEVRRCDVTVEEDLMAAFDAAEARGPLQVVVHCVGAWDYPRLTELTLGQVEQSLALNLTSALLVLREAGRRVQDGGRVVLLSSVAARVAPARQVTYAAAKAGMEAGARVAAKELAARGITVNVVRPGATDTATLRTGTSGAALEAMAKANGMRRLGTPDDVAEVVFALVAPGMGWVTGEVIEASGGLP